MYKIVLVAMLSFCAATLFNGCKKNDTATTSDTLPADQKLIDHNLLISFAKDDGSDITSNYTGLVFKYNGTAKSLSGSATAANGILNVTGTWALNATRNRITFAFPTNVISELSYLNKQWEITNPSTNPVVLKALFGENDEVRFSTQ